MLKKLKVFTIFIAITFLLSASSSANAASCEDSCENKSDADKLSCLNDIRAACEAKLKEVEGQKTTLNSTISYLNGKINITQAQINQTQAEIAQLQKGIDSLSGKIGILNLSLDKLTQLLISRIVATYKSDTIDPLYLLFTSDGFAAFLSRYKYLRVTQQHDRKIIFELEQARTNYDQQKDVKEEKQEQVLGLQTELVSQKTTLNSQKQSKQQLLTITQNDERRFQKLLAAVQAEYEAIQSILAGGGSETQIGEVYEGEKIASVIVGNSCNSSGTHLHFSVTENNNVKNPFGSLKSVDHENCSGPGPSCNPGDPFNPSGNWNWPLNPKITLNQGFGSTWAVKNTWVGQYYSSHNGIDIIGSSLDTKAVKAGTLYRGSYTGSTGCTLRYVKVEHKDSNIETYYLHVNYIK